MGVQKGVEPGRVALEVVEGRRDLARFLAVPHHVYASDPAWTAPLNIEQRQRFSPKNHFFRHARWRAWVATRDGRPVGRISAQVDERHQKRYGDGVGYFGLIEAEDDPAVFAALFAAAGDWLQGQGMRRIRGPFNLHINEELGLLVEGFDTPPRVLMSHARPYYQERIAALGFKGVKDLLAYSVRPDFEAPAAMRRLVSRLVSPEGERVRVRPLRRYRLREEAMLMLDVFNDAWRDNWGFVPLEPESWYDTVKTLVALMPDEYIQVAEHDGEPVAFIVALPDINEAARDLNGRVFPLGWLKLLWRLKVRHPRGARVPLMGVRRRFQRSRKGIALAFAVIDAVRRELHRRGVVDVEMSWILEDNEAMRGIIEAIGGVVSKRYRMYEKAIG